MYTNRIIIADDHSIVVDGLRSKLGGHPNIQVVEGVCDSQLLLPLIEQHQPYLLILDISMPKIDGIEIISQVKSRYAHIKILVYTVHVSLQKIHECLSRGADGYAVKGDQHTDILSAVLSVMDGHLFLSPSIGKILVTHYLSLSKTTSTDSTQWYTLTPRERDIIRLSAQGMHTKEIAYQLGLSMKSISNCRYRLKKKLNLPHLSALHRYALENGLLDSADV